MKLQKIVVCLFSLILVLSCGSSEDSKKNAGAEVECSDNNVKAWAYENLNDYYLFYNRVPVVDPTAYSSAASLVEELRVQPYDRFSRIAVASEEEEVFDEGKTFGPGVFLLWDSSDRLRVATVYSDSPLGRAGVSRGDELLSINGAAVGTFSYEEYLAFVGTREQPRTSTWQFSDANTKAVRDIAVKPAVFEVNTVIHNQIITHANYSGKIGYLVFDSFLGTAEAELDAAIDVFKQNDIQELVLDLRYNGGGYLYIASKLASQLASPSLEGEMLMEYRHNVKYALDYDFEIPFEPVEKTLNLDRLIVLTDEYTASASEVIINGLSPYIEVVTIGSRTVGKPYMSFGNKHCGHSMHALQAEGFNANDVSVYGGIDPSCGATDDLDNDFGVSEGMLGAALDYLVYGSCQTPELGAVKGLQNDESNPYSFLSPWTKPGANGGSRVD